MKNLRLSTMASARPISIVSLPDTDKVLVLVYAQGIDEPLIHVQTCLQGLYLPEYDSTGVKASNNCYKSHDRVTVHISKTHNVFAALMSSRQSSVQSLQCGYAQCLSMQTMLEYMITPHTFGYSRQGNPLPLINGSYPDTVYATKVREYLQQQLQPKDEVTKAVQMTLPVTKAMPFRVMSREQVDELLSARDAKMMAIRDAKAKAHHAEEAVRIAQQSAAAHINAVRVLESELEKIIVLLQGGEV